MDAEIIEQIDTIDVCYDEPTELEVEVAVSDINLQPLSVTKNGTYTTPQGVNGFDTVKVSVLPTTEEKTLTVTENGNYTVEPTEADTLSKVEVEVKVYPKVQPDGISWRGNGTVTYVAGELIDTSNITSMEVMFQNCSKLEKVDTSEWVTDKVKNVSYQFWQNHELKALDMSNWNLGACTSFNVWIVNCYGLRTLIGDHTLEEVESGKIVAIKDAGKSSNSVTMSWQAHPQIRYASILAVALGLYDRTGLDTGTWQISSAAFNDCSNDDDTIPDADTLAARQAKIRAICAEKNYNLVLS